MNKPADGKVILEKNSKFKSKQIGESGQDKSSQKSDPFKRDNCMRLSTPGIKTRYGFVTNLRPVKANGKIIGGNKINPNHKTGAQIKVKLRELSPQGNTKSLTGRPPLIQTDISSYLTKRRARPDTKKLP